MSSRLGVKVRPPFSDSVVIGPDELEADRVVQGLSFSTELPGGFGPADFSFGVPDGVTPNKTWLLCPIEIFDADTAQLRYRGRITAISVSDNTASVECEGWSKHLSDNEYVREIFIDRDATQFGEPSAQRKKELNSVGYVWNGSVQANQYGGTTKVPCVELSWSGSQVQEGWHMIAEAWYDGKGIPIEKMCFSYVGSGKRAAGFNCTAIIVDNNHGPAYNYGASVNFEFNTYFTGLTEYLVTKGTPASVPNEAAALVPKYFAALLSSYTGAGTGLLIDICWFLQPQIFGEHKLPVRGTFPQYGFYTSDIVAYLVGKYAPLADYTTGEGGSISPTSFLITHLVYKEQVATTVASILETLAVLGGGHSLPMDWGVYEQFFYKEQGTYGQTWRVRNDEADEAADQGPDASARLNGVIILYDQGMGLTESVGPVGSGATHETSKLEDKNPSNPANNDGAKHWKAVSVGVMTQSQAELLGGLVLAMASATDWRGSVTCVKQVRDEAGNVHPVEAMRAGDHVVVEDDPEGDTRPRRIVNTDYTEAEERNVCAIGLPPDYLSVVLARAGLVLSSAGLS